MRDLIVHLRVTEMIDKRPKWLHGRGREARRDLVAGKKHGTKGLDAAVQC